MKPVPNRHWPSPVCPPLTVGGRVATAAALVLGLAIPGAACNKKKSKNTTDAVAAKDDSKAPGPDPGLCDVVGKRVLLFDLNRDRAADVWKVYSRTEEAETRLEVMSCKQVDFDHDGRKDYVVEYDAKGGKRVERFDFDFDGRFDAAFQLHERSGKPTKVERDSNFDGRYDLVEAYDDDGVLESVERDRNADGEPDLWEQYLRGKLVAVLYDDNYDEEVDRREEVDITDDDTAWPPAASDDAAPTGSDAGERDADKASDKAKGSKR
jgi:hypothetical protein